MIATEPKIRVSSKSQLLSPNSRPDAYFSENQINRLRELMCRVQTAERPPEDILTSAEFSELKALVSAELQATARRAKASLDQ